MTEKKRGHRKAIYGKAMSGADRKRRMMARGNIVERRQCADPDRRSELESDTEAWLRHYFPQTFFREFERPHKELIERSEQAQRDGSRMVVAAERGIGKSACLYALVLKFKLSGVELFPVYIPWSEKAKRQGFGWWRNALCHNEILDQDYPEYTAPFRHSKGISQRIRNTVWGEWDNESQEMGSGDPTGCEFSVTDGLIVMPDGLGCIGSSSINGNPRGLNHSLPDGRLLRPTLGLIDDVQDHKVAKSKGPNGLVADTIRRINGDVGGLGAAGREFPILMSGNCIASGDVTDHFLNNDGWAAVHVPCITSWPAGWDSDGAKVRELWDELCRIYKDKGDDAEYYTANKATMTRGLELSAPLAFADGIKATESRKGGRVPAVDPMHAVIRAWADMGSEAFMAERQQAPIDPADESTPYVVTPQLILNRTENRRPFERPEWVTDVVASTDINWSYALTTTLLGFGQDQRCAVLWHGMFRKAPLPIPDGIPRREFSQRIMTALAEHGKELRSCPLSIDTWWIDASGTPFDAVVRFARESVALVGVQAVAATGRGWKQYREYGPTFDKSTAGRERVHGRIDRRDGSLIRWAVWHADHWKEMAQCAWLGTPGAAGTASLPSGDNAEFAAQVCGEKLLGKGEIGGQMAWNFVTAPGRSGRHDYLDVLAQGYAAAALRGIGTGSSGSRRQRTRPRIRHVSV